MPLSFIEIVWSCKINFEDIPLYFLASVQKIMFVLYRACLSNMIIVWISHLYTKLTLLLLILWCSPSGPFSGHANAVIVTPSPLKADVVPNTGVVITSSHIRGVCCHYFSHCLLFFLEMTETHLYFSALIYWTQMVKYSSLFVSFHASQAPGFHVVSQTQKPIVPKEKSYSPNRKNQKTASSVGENSPFPQSILYLQMQHIGKKVCFCLLFFLVHSQPASGQGSPCVLDQVPSPQPLISSSTSLIKNEQNQVCFGSYFWIKMTCSCYCFIVMSIFS